MSSEKQLDSRPIKTILAERLKVYENAHPACKEGLGLFLKTTRADVQAKRLEYRTKKVG